MDKLIDILRYSMGSLVWGFFIGVVCIVLFFLLIKGWYKDAMFKPITYVVGIILGLILIFQCTLICGSLSIINMADDMKPILSKQIETYTTNQKDYISVEESDEIIKKIAYQNPLLAQYIGGDKFSGYTASELPDVIISKVRTSMRWFIFRRVMWSLGFVLLSAIIVIKTMERKYTSKIRTQRVNRTDRARTPRTECRRVRRKV